MIAIGAADFPALPTFRRKRRGAGSFVLALSLALFVGAFALAGRAAADVKMLGLYQSRPIVTGTGEENRKLGFALALEEVLVKVSGDARLIGDPRLKAIDAGSLVADFKYRDRMEGIPIHDEQGSHDRPHDLTVTFDEAKIDATLRSLGDEPWRAERPTLVVFLGVTFGERTFVLASDGERGIDMRESLDNATFRVNIPAKVPDQATLDAAGLDVTNLKSADLSKLGAIAEKVGGRAIVGNLEFSDKAHGWLTTWRMIGDDGKPYEWHQQGVSFDEAFRNAVRGAAEVLSGHGAPS